MSDLEFDVASEWKGDAATGQGYVITGGTHLEYSAPASMGGSGVGSNPEELLLSAIVSCYTIGLARLLHKRGLPSTSVNVQMRGTVSGHPFVTVFARIVVSPTIAGGDPSRMSDYEAAAQTARDRCFIGKTLSENVAYEVGKVSLAAEARLRLT